MKSTDIAGISPSAMRAWLTLSAALERLEDERRPRVCQADPDAWTSVDRTDRAAAATGCMLSRCPLSRRAATSP